MLNKHVQAKDDAMKLKRCFYGTIQETGEQVIIEDWRKIIDTTTMLNKDLRTTTLGDKMYCRTRDGRKVHCLDEKYVNAEALQGEWEIQGSDDTWMPIDVRLHQ